MAESDPLLLLRVDVSREHGTGHLMRSKALGDAWKRAGGRVEFLTASDLTPYAGWLADWPAHWLPAAPGSAEDARITLEHARAHRAAWVVADGYVFDAAWQREFVESQPLLLFDDHGHGAPHSATVLLNQNPGATEALYADRSAGTQLLLGPRFASLREQFLPWRGWQRATAPIAKRVLATFGGTDVADLSRRAAKALRGLPFEVALVIGGGNPHAAEIEALCTGTNVQARRNVYDMPELMAQCDFVLCAAGSTTLEAAFLQLPQLLLTVADNQLLLADGFAESGAAELLGWHTDVSSAQIRQAVTALAAEPARRAAMSSRAAQLIDGLGAERVVAHLRATIGLPMDFPHPELAAS